MAIDYSSLLTDDQKREIITQRLQQFAAEAYQHSINLNVAKKTGSEEGVAQSEQSLAILEAAIEVHQEELKKL